MTKRYVLKILWLSFVILFLYACKSGQYLPFTKVHAERIDSIAQEKLNTFHYPGLAISVSHRGQLIYSKGFGFADIENNISVDPSSSLFRIGSISKALTSVALAQLVEAGKIDLDNEVQEYVPYFPKKEYPINVRQIALHTSGIRHYRGMEFILNIQFNSVKEAIKIFMDDPLQFEPGTKYLYSSYGWNLISAVIEGASEQSFLDYMDHNVFNHSSLNYIQPDDPTLSIANKVKFYHLEADNQLVETIQVNNSYKWAGGGFLSCATDLIAFGDAVLSDHWISETTRNEFWTRGKLKNGEEIERGLGWHTGTDEYGRYWVGHAGGSVGGSSNLVIYPDEKLIVAVLINLSEANRDKIAYKIADIVLSNK